MLTPKKLHQYWLDAERELIKSREAHAESVRKRKRDKLRKQALAKLTQEERESLDL